jgi:hypothetical protein
MDGLRYVPSPGVAGMCQLQPDQNKIILAALGWSQLQSR